LANGAGGVATQTPPPEHSPAPGVVPHALAVVLQVHGGIVDMGIGVQLPANEIPGAVRRKEPGFAPEQPVVTQRPGGNP
jgi:hypothetical protein